MIKATSRGDGVDFDAQAAARDAARREGKSLGQWLHGAITDRAADLGIRESDMAGKDRLEAVTARLERLGGRTGPAPRRQPHASRAEAIRQRPLDASADERRLSWRGDTVADVQARPARDWIDESAGDAEAERLLAGAITAMERRAARSERRTDEALASFANLMEVSEKRRAQERDAVTALTQQMATLETALSQHFSSGDSPIKGALARLEARLDLIGKRGAAESAARQHAAAAEAVPADGDAVRRLEDKINTILQAVHGSAPQTVAAASPLALKAAQMAEPSRRRLGDAIAEIAQRQHNLDDAAGSGRERTPARAATDAKPAAGLNHATPAPLTQPSAAEPADAARLPFPLRRGAKGEDILPAASLNGSGGAASTVRPARAGDTVPSIALAPAPDQWRLDQDMSAIAARLGGLQPAGQEEAQAVKRGTVPAVGGAGRAAAIQDPATAESLQKIEQRLDVIAGRVREALQQKPVVEPPRVELGGLEAMVRDLAAKLDLAGAPGADAHALDALQQQVEVLSTRFERSEHDLSLLPTLAASVRGLFDQLETVRASVETSAAHAAREVLRIAVDDGRKRGPAAEAETAVPDTSQEVVTAVQSMLGGVHDMLDKVVGRLSAVESNLAEVRAHPLAAASVTPSAVASAPVAPPLAGPVFRPATQRPAAPKMAGGSPDLPFGGAEAAREPILPLPGGRRADPQPGGRPTDADEDAQRVNFIAAARRAAKTAQTEPAVAPPQRTAAAEAPDARAGLMDTSREYVAAHKRPVLMGLAAILVVLGTLALLQRTGLGAGDTVATAPAPQAAKVARAGETIGQVASQPSSEPDARRQGFSNAGDLTPGALPKAPLPAAADGNDPIQTGSIPSLPSFAAQAPGGAAARPAGLPVGLQTAAEAGNPSAQYELGVRYADGRSVGRDAKVAALWLAKAADQGFAPAQYRLASFFEKGVGVAQDKARAKKLYTQASEAGNPRAMHNLAVMLADGDGHPDYPGAADWFRKAATYGIHDSQYNLAILLARGLGVPQSLVQSYQWFAIAAAQNDADAAHKRDEVGSKLSASDLAAAKAFAAAFQPKAVEPAAEALPSSTGWDGAPGASHLNSAKSKVSSL